MSEVENQEEVLDQEIVDETVDSTDDSGAENYDGGDETEIDETTEEGEESEEGEEGDDANSEEEGEEGSEEDQTKFKFKAGVFNKETQDLEQKEFEIPKKFHALMKDPETAKEIKELHEKAFGLESVKERHNQTRGELQTVRAEATELKNGVNGLRKIYQSATGPGGNIHKLDAFFEKLRIPQDVIHQYTYEKVRLSEMDETQKNAVLSQLSAERRADELAQQQEQYQTTLQEQVYEQKMVQLDLVLSKPEVSELVAEFDARVGKDGAFKEAAEKEGKMAWFTQKKDLTPAEAVQAVIRNFALDKTPLIPPAKNAAVVNGQQNPSVIKRTNTVKTMPNLGGRNSMSPAKTAKVKSMDELMKYRKDTYGA